MSALTKNNSFKPLFRSPLNNKIKRYEIISKSNQNTDQKNNNNIKIKKTRYKRFNVKCNELFKETKFKFLKRNNLKNIEIYSQKEIRKEKDKNETKIKNINLNITSRLNEKNNTNKSKFINYKLSTPVIKNRVVKKLLNINKSKEIILKSNSIKSINNKKQGIEKEKKFKNKKDVALSLKNFANKKNSNSVVFTENRPKSKSKMIEQFNKFNKRNLSSNINCKNRKDNNNSRVNKTQKCLSSKNDIKKNIKNTINNIFRDMPKNCADNPIILYKFNSLIRNMKNIQHIIQSKKNSFSSDKNPDDNKNNEGEKI